MAPPWLKPWTKGKEAMRLLLGGGGGGGGSEMYAGQTVVSSHPVAEKMAHRQPPPADTPSTETKKMAYQYQAPHTSTILSSLAWIFYRSPHPERTLTATLHRTATATSTPLAG